MELVEDWIDFIFINLNFQGLFIYIFYLLFSKDS